MKLSLKLNGRPCETEANPQSDGSFLVTVNGREFKTRVAGTDGRHVDVAVQDTHHKISFDGPPSGSSFEARVNGRQVRVESGDGKPLEFAMGTAAPQRARGRTPSAKPPGPGMSAAETPSRAAVSGAVLAPMPGTVIAIGRQIGDKVDTGDKIMTIEAMKMENEIRVEKAGEIKEIRVSVGSAVLSHDVLAVIG